MNGEGPLLRLTYMKFPNAGEEFRYGTKNTILTKEEATRVVRRRSQKLRESGTVNSAVFILDSLPFANATPHMEGGAGFNLSKDINLDTFDKQHTYSKVVR